MIRLTDGMTGLASARDLQRLSRRLFESQQQASSGLRIQTPSDDPSLASQLSEVDAQRSGLVQFQRNVDRASAELASADEALSGAAELLQRARELGLAMANGATAESDRQQAAGEIATIRDQLVSLANTRHGNRHIFSGYATDRPAFDSTGTYLGDTNRRRIQVDETLTLDVGLNGAEVFSAAGGVDVFAALADLETALQNNDPTAVMGSSSTLEAAREQTTAARAAIGVQARSIAEHSQNLAERETRSRGDRAEIADADALEALSDLASAQQALNAAVQVSARMLSTLSLVDRL
jgi:flagellar hook-associated protein 3 FlgL